MCTHTQTHTCTHICTHTHASTHIHVYTHLSTNTHTHSIYTHVHEYMHTQTHTHTHTLSLSLSLTLQTDMHSSLTVLVSFRGEQTQQSEMQTPKTLQSSDFYNNTLPYPSPHTTCLPCQTQNRGGGENNINWQSWYRSSTSNGPGVLGMVVVLVLQSQDSMKVGQWQQQQKKKGGGR